MLLSLKRYKQHRSINNIGGHIYNNNSSATALQQATVFIAAEDTATLTNSGTIENKAGPENYSIRIAGMLRDCNFKRLRKSNR